VEEKPVNGHTSLNALIAREDKVSLSQLREMMANAPRPSNMADTDFYSLVAQDLLASQPSLVFMRRDVNELLKAGPFTTHRASEFADDVNPKFSIGSIKISIKNVISRWERDARPDYAEAERLASDGGLAELRALLPPPPDEADLILQPLSGSGHSGFDHERHIGRQREDYAQNISVAQMRGAINALTQDQIIVDAFRVRIETNIAVNEKISNGKKPVFLSLSLVLGAWTETVHYIMDRQAEKDRKQRQAAAERTGTDIGKWIDSVFSRGLTARHPHELEPQAPLSNGHAPDEMGSSGFNRGAWGDSERQTSIIPVGGREISYTVARPYQEEPTRGLMQLLPAFFAHDPPYHTDPTDYDNFRERLADLAVNPLVDFKVQSPDFSAKERFALYFLAAAHRAAGTVAGRLVNSKAHQCLVPTKNQILRRYIKNMPYATDLSVFLRKMPTVWCETINSYEGLGSAARTRCIQVGQRVLRQEMRLSKK
jgi:hypothetical protein